MYLQYIESRIGSSAFFSEKARYLCFLYACLVKKISVFQRLLAQHYFVSSKLGGIEKQLEGLSLSSSQLWEDS